MISNTWRERSKSSSIKARREMGRPKFVVAEACKEVALHEIRVGKSLRRRMGLREGDIVEATTPRPILLWVRENGDGRDAKISVHTARVLGLGKRYLLELEKVRVSEAVYVELSVPRGYLGKINLQRLKTALHLVPLRAGGYVITALPREGVVALKVKRAYPPRCLVTLNTMLLLSRE